MRKTGYRLTAAAAVMAMLLTGVPLSATAEEAGKETTVSLNANVDRAPYFSQVLASYPDTPGGDTVTVPAGEVEGEPLTWTADHGKGVLGVSGHRPGPGMSWSVGLPG